MKHHLVGLVILFAWVLPVFSADQPLPEQAAALLVRRCLECHSGADPQGKLDLTTRASLLKGGESGPAIDDGERQKSPLWQRVVLNEMPPKQPLSAEEKRLLQAWIGAETPYAVDPLSPWQYSSEKRAGLEWWSLQPLRTVGIPDPKTSTALSPIDAFHLHDLHAAGLTANPPAGRRALIRRLSFNLLGLPPAPGEIDDFLVDERPDAYERLVDRLLASPHYGERWARHWLDVVRYGESNGFERDLPRPNSWHYRDWVIGAFNADLSYPDFVRRQVAGNPADPQDAESLKATGFLVAGPHDTVVPSSDKMRQSMRFDELEDIIGTIGQTFLGLTVNCARCHDHKFDPVSQTEYYQLAAALSGVDHGEKEYLPRSVVEELAAVRPRIEELTARLRQQEEPLRKKILAARNQPAKEAPVPPAPLAAWDFAKGLTDVQGKLPVTLHGAAKQTAEGLMVEGQSAFAATTPLTKPLREKTLEVRVRLANLQQRGGGVISVQTLDGGVFDAVVFGEQEAGRWMAGSNGFVRTQSFQGEAETTADKEFSVFSIVYKADGTITGYRNGQLYGRAYQSQGLQAYEADKSQIVFGLRHGPVGGNKMLAGVIASARLYDRALSAEEVAASALAADVFVTEAELRELLTDAQRTERSARQTELQTLRDRETLLAKNGPVKVYTAALSQPGPVRFLKRGNVAEPGDVVVPAGLSAVPAGDQSFRLPADSPEAVRRQALSEWLVSPQNPLAVRTIVNRLWHYHFGSGFVETPNDLGFNGGQPAHPELFDWLCGEFLRTGGGIKQFHRQVVTSAAYRQSSAARPDHIAVDSGNRKLWRMSPRRLEAEAVRDAMLSVAGELNESLDGPSYLDFNSFFFKGTQFYEPLDSTDANTQRRTVYRMWARGGRSPFLDTFDCPDPSTTTPRRSSTTTPLQALALMNNTFALRMAERLAARAESSANRQTTIEAVYRFAYGREPRKTEIVAAQDFITRRGVISFCRVVLNSSEFLYVE